MQIKRIGSNARDIGEDKAIEEASTADRTMREHEQLFLQFCASGDELFSVSLHLLHSLLHTC